MIKDQNLHSNIDLRREKIWIEHHPPVKTFLTSIVFYFTLLTHPADRFDALILPRREQACGRLQEIER